MVHSVALLIVRKNAVKYADDNSAVRKLQAEIFAFHVPKLLLVFQSPALVFFQLFTFTDNAYLLVVIIVRSP